VSSATQLPAIVIRDIDRISEIHEVETLQKDVWGSDDLDVVPLTLLVASKEVGAVLVGAYDGSSLVGFVYGFPGYENGHFTHHSHMLAVMPSYRNSNLGYRLKLAQCERVLAQHIKQITWTFDPLQSLNAHINFGKLGVVADSYKINFYGETTSSFLHQVGTDRLWVTWLIDSQRVRERLQSEDKSMQSQLDLEAIPRLVEVRSDGPLLCESSEIFGKQQVSIEIPGDINALQDKDSELALRWREATRWAFTEALASGYLIEDFYRSNKSGQWVGTYLLSRGRKIDDFR
jgi:predicted GNAT superfamily acetyltransferase